jgi:hypothetical protein
MAQGYDDGLYGYSFPGDPTDAPVSSFNPPNGALIVDTENFVLYQKTSSTASLTYSGTISVGVYR